MDAENPEAPADPVADAIAAEDTLYAGVVSGFRGLRRVGGGWIESALLTMTHLVVINTVSED